MRIDRGKQKLPPARRALELGEKRGDVDAEEKSPCYQLLRSERAVQKTKVATQPGVANGPMIEHARVASSFVCNGAGDRERRSSIFPEEESNAHSAARCP